MKSFSRNGCVILAVSAAGTCFAQTTERPRMTDLMELTGRAMVLKSSMATSDINGDGLVTDLDVLIAVYDKVYSQPLTDIDQDGVVTAADGILSIRQVITSTMSDPDGDGKVSWNDALMVAAELNKLVPDLKVGDTNGDGRVTLEDLQKVLDEQDLDTITGDAPMELAQEIFSHMGWAIEVGIENLRAVEAIPHSRIVSTDWETPQGTPPADAHTIATSKVLWPANHYYSVSVQWRRGLPNQVPAIPGHTTNTSTEWPANHEWDYSRTWVHPPGKPYEPYLHSTWISELIPTHSSDTSMGLVPETHHLSVSGKWPLNHQGSLSRLWPLTTHSRDASMQWPGNHLVAASQSGSPLMPNHSPALSALAPTTHATAVSDAWPPAHLGNVSHGWPVGHTVTDSKGYPPNHIAVHSAAWDWSTHSAALSCQWPPNHDGTISRTWNNHVVTTSITWPASHGHAVSTTWTPVGYRGWPANHDLAVSNSWHQPAPAPAPFWNWPNQAFPAGHSWMTTIMPFIPYIPIPRPPSN